MFKKTTSIVLKKNKSIGSYLFIFYQGWSICLVQSGVEHRYAEVFALLPAEGGRDVQLAVRTLGGPRHL